MGAPQDPSLLILAGKCAWPRLFWAFESPGSSPRYMPRGAHTRRSTSHLCDFCCIFGPAAASPLNPSPNSAPCADPWLGVPSRPAAPRYPLQANPGLVPPGDEAAFGPSRKSACIHRRARHRRQGPGPGVKDRGTEAVTTPNLARLVPPNDGGQSTACRLELHLAVIASHRIATRP